MCFRISALGLLQPFIRPSFIIVYRSGYNGLLATATICILCGLCRDRWLFKLVINLSRILAGRPAKVAGREPDLHRRVGHRSRANDDKKLSGT